MAPPSQLIHMGAEPRTGFTTEGLILTAAGSVVPPLVPILLPELSLTEEGHLVVSPSQGKRHQLLTQDSSGGPSPPWVLI